MKFQIRKIFRLKHKLFFPPGLLSLALLPLLGFHILFSDECFHNVNSLRIAYMSKAMMERMAVGFPPKNIPVISIQGNSDERKQKVNSVLNEINYLQKTGIDSSVFQINLEDQSTWGDYISVLTIFHKKKLKVYFIDGNKIWVYPDTTYRRKMKPDNIPKYKPFERPVQPPIWIFHGDLVRDPELTDNDAVQLSSLQLMFKNRNFIFFISAFCFLLIVNIISIRKTFFLREG